MIPNPSTGMQSFANAISGILSVVGRYAHAFDHEKIVIHRDGTWIVRGFSKATGRHWVSKFRVDESGESWELVSDKTSRR